jgi:hypothetical protein
LSETGNNPHDQSKNYKDAAIENGGQPIADAETDHDGKNQDQADAAGAVPTLKQLLQKLFGVFTQRLPCPVCCLKKMNLFTCAYLSYPRKLVNNFWPPPGRKFTA